MTDHVFDELPLLLTGEADRTTLESSVGHLRTCEDCQQDLISTLVAHGSLSSAARFAPELARTSEPVDDLEIQAASALPDLEPVFAQARHEAATADAPAESAPAKGRHRGRWLVAAAVAAALVGGGVATAVSLDHGTSGRSVTLDAYGRGAVPAKATIVDGNHVSVNASTLPAPDSGQRYEVWLTDAGRTHVQPVGWVGADGKGSYTVPSDLIRQFVAIEVSVQRLNAPYTFSGVSVLRGTYA